MHESGAVRNLIASGKKLLLAGDEHLLASWPKGSWIGGTIPYFMTEQGGTFTKDRIFVTEIPVDAAKVEIRNYDERTVSGVYEDIPERAVSFIMIPALSKTHSAFAINAPTFAAFATRPLVGWITGVDVADIGKVSPRIFDGSTGESRTEGAVTMQVTLPAGKVAEVDILNLFVQGKGDSIRFEQDGFSIKDAVINGKRQSFVQYLKDREIDTRLPLVADFGGAMINTGFQTLDEAAGVVSFYAPVFAGVDYRMGVTEGDYVSSFQTQISQRPDAGLLFSCNCILNYLYAGLEGKRTGTMTGPVTFGEIAYQLLNQTMVYVRMTDG